MPWDLCRGSPLTPPKCQAPVQVHWPFSALWVRLLQEAFPTPHRPLRPPPPHSLCCSYSPGPVSFVIPPQEQVPGHRQQEGLSGGDDDDGYSCRSWPVGRTCRRQSHLDELDTGSLSLEGCKREFPREGTQYCWGSEEAGGRGPRGRLLRRQGGKWEGASRQGWGQGPGPRGTAPAKVEA